MYSFTSVPKRASFSSFLFIQPISLPATGGLSIRPLRRRARRFRAPLGKRPVRVCVHGSQGDEPISEGLLSQRAVAPASLTTDTVDETLLSPMMQHYVQTRRRLSLSLCASSDRRLLLLYRVGDFFESFFEDAHLLSALCGVALTSKEAGKALRMRVPMAGVPHFCVDDKVPALLAANVSVAVVDQVTRPASHGTPAAGLVQRAVTRLLTPATASEDGLRDATRPAYVCAIVVRPLPAAEARRHAVEAPAAVALASRDGDEGDDDACAFGLAYADACTGEFRATAGASLSAVHSLLATLRPAEVIVAAGRGGSTLAARVVDTARRAGNAVITTADALPEAEADRLLADFHRVDSVESLGCRHMPQTVQAAAALVSFLTDTLSVDGDPGGNGVGSSSVALNRLTTFAEDDFMHLDENCLKNLEVLESARDAVKNRSLQWAVDRTVTPMGARRLRSWLLRPLTDLRAIAARHDIVQALTADKGTVVRNAVRKSLRNFADLERLGGRVSSGRVTPRELRWLCESVVRLPDLFACLSSCVDSGEDGEMEGNPTLEWVGGVDEALVTLAVQVLDGLMDPAPSSMPSELAISGGSAAKENWDTASMRVFRPGYDNELDMLRRAVAEPEAWITTLEQQERERSGIDSLRIKHIKNSGYVIRVARTVGERKLDEDVAFFSRLGYERVQSTKAELRFTFPNLKARAREHHAAVSEVLLLERRLFLGLCERMMAFVSTLRQLGAQVARIDVVAGFAHVAAENGYIRPHVLPGDEHVLDIHDGRHPVVEQLLPAGKTFVANTLQIGHAGDDDGGDDGKEKTTGFGSLLLLCGPNAAGKSCALRSLGLICILAQCGCFVPARFARISVCDRVFTRVGAVDDVARGQSTFQVEMAETACILSHATSHSLVLLDEIGRGTSTADGIAIAWSVAEHLSQRKESDVPRTMFVTHFHELNHLSTLYDNVKSFHVRMQRVVSVEEDDDGDGDGDGDSGDQSADWMSTHVIMPGPSYESMGLAMAERAGFPAAVLKRAHEISTIVSNPCKAVGAQLQLALASQRSVTHAEPADNVEHNNNDDDNDALHRDSDDYDEGFAQGYKRALADVEANLQRLRHSSSNKVANREENTREVSVVHSVNQSGVNGT